MQPTPNSAGGDRPDSAPSPGAGPVPPGAEQLMFAAARGPRLVYIGLKTKAEFDALELPAHVGEWKADKVETLIRKHKGDARAWESRCTFKSIDSPIIVTFQWWEQRAVEPCNADPGDEHQASAEVTA